MRLRFTVLTPVDVSLFTTAIRAQAGFEQHPFRKLNFATGAAGLVTGTVTFRTRRTYQQGGSQAMTL
jgi:hypothetical protein